MEGTHALRIPILIGVLTLGVLVGSFVTGTVVMGQDPSATVQQNQQLLDELVAKDAIREQIYNYSRGLDRMDQELAMQVWHPDGTTNFLGIYEGTGAGFIEWVWAVHEPYVAHSHQMTNILIKVDGDTAVSETYMMAALHAQPTENSANTSVVRGRYADKWSKRNGRWAIDHRLYFSTSRRQTLRQGRTVREPGVEIGPTLRTRSIHTEDRKAISSNCRF